MTEKSLSEFTTGQRVTRNRFAFTLIFTLAIILRFYAVINFPAKPASDAADYHRLAMSIVTSHGYLAQNGSPTAWRPPGYPFFLAGIYSIAGESVFTAYMVQAILGGLTVLALMYLAMAILGRKAAIVSGVMAALYPGLIYPSRSLMSENLAIPLLLLSICVAVRIARSDSLWAPASLGALLGLSILTRGASVIAAALLLGAILLTKWRTGGMANAFKCVSIVAMALAIILAPWGVRNYAVFHRRAPLATQDGIAFYASYWPPRKGSKLIWGTLPREEDPVVAASSGGADEVAVSEYLKRETINRLRAEPQYFFQLWPSKLIYLLAPFDWEIFPHSAGASRSFNWGYVFIVLPAALGALIIGRKSTPRKWALLALPASVLIQSLIFYGSPRFRLIAEPIALIAAAMGAIEIFEFTKRRYGAASGHMADSRSLPLAVLIRRLKSSKR
ncbi:MAG TPA: glycosyltransferase family 39 protein [Blastocatellia bacterium]|nr:glycosyltransferase family 39 protein [Blastocatellia bacterium]